MLRKKKVLVAGLVALLVLALVALGGSWAWFSSQVESEDNTFTAGTLDLEISNDGTSWGDTATATWESPSNWAPGETFTATVQIKNVGNIDANYLGTNWGSNFDFTDPDSAGSNLANAIEVVALEEYIPGYGWIDNLDPDGQNYQGLVEDGVDPFTLMELMQSYHGGEPAWADGRVQDEFGGWVGTLTDAVTGSGYDVTPGPAIIAGGTYRMRMAFKFLETAGNEYQGDSCSFDISYTAMQDLSQLP